MSESLAKKLDRLENLIKELQEENKKLKTGETNLTDANFTGTVSASTLTAISELNIPGGKIWIE